MLAAAGVQVDVRLRRVRGVRRAAGPHSARR
jgi:hypothetical protein